MTPADAWQPIASAPRDEFVWIAHASSGDMGFARLYCWRSKSGTEHCSWIALGISGHDWEWDNLGKPTHWQPLPAPPRDGDG